MNKSCALEVVVAKKVHVILFAFATNYNKDLTIDTSNQGSCF